MTAVALTIAGSDPSGGAGIEADLKTFSALGVYGATVITALTAQNTKGVFGIHDVPPDFVAAELNAVFTDLDPGAVKIGMLANAATIDVVIAALDRYQPRNVVLDPVIIATSGKKLLRGDALGRLRELIARARVVTPNLPEAAVLLETTPAGDEDEMRAQAQQLLAWGPVRCSSKAAMAVARKASIFSSMPVAKCCAWRRRVLPRRTPMAPAARCPRRSPPGWPRGCRCRRQRGKPKLMSAPLSPPPTGSASVQAAAPCIIFMPDGRLPRHAENCYRFKFPRLNGGDQTMLSKLTFVTALALLLAVGHACAAEYEIVNHADLVFAEHDGTKLVGDLYLPKGRSKVPVLVAVHGGGWQVGSKQFYRYWGLFLARAGYAVFAVDYRLGKPGVYPAAVYDVKAAVQYIRAKAGEFDLDPDRIGLIGDSAGAHLASLVALAGDQFNSAYRDDATASVSAKVKCVIGFYGVYDMHAQWTHDLTSRPNDKIVEKFLGISPMQNRRVNFDASPISYATVDTISCDFS